jgi:chromosome segregation ATPase
MYSLRIEYLEEELESAKQHVERFKTAAARKGADLSTAIAKLESLNATISEKNDELADLQNSLRQSLSDCSSLEAELAITKQKVEEGDLQARAELKLLSAKCVELESQIAERERENSKCVELESSISEKEATILELQNSLQRSLSDYERAEEELTTTKQAMKIFKEDDTQKEAELTKARAEVELLHSKCAELEEELESEKQTVEAAKRGDALKAVDLSNALAELQSLRSKLVQSDSTLSEKEAKVAELQSSLEQSRSDCSRVEAELAKLEEPLHSKCAVLESSISEKGAAILELQNSLRQSLSDYERVEGELAATKQEMESAKQADARKEADVRKAHAELELLHSRCLRLESEADLLHDGRLEQALETAQQKEADLTQARADLELLRSKCAQLNSTVLEKEVRLVDVESALRESLRDGDRREEALTSAQRNVERLTQEDAQKAAELRHTRGELEMLHAKCVRLQHDVEVETAGSKFAEVVRAQDTRLHELTHDVEVLAGKYEEASASKATLQGELAGLLHEMEVEDVSALTRAVLQNKDLLQSAESETKELQQQLDDMIQAVESVEQDMHTKVEQLSHETSTLKQSLQHAEEQSTSQSSRIASLQSELTSLKSEAEELEDVQGRDLKRLQEELRAAKEKIRSLVYISREREEFYASLPTGASEDALQKKEVLLLCLFP